MPAFGELSELKCMCIQLIDSLTNGGKRYRKRSNGSSNNFVRDSWRSSRLVNERVHKLFVFGKQNK